MKRILLTITALVTFTFAGIASADPIPVTYDIGPYAAGGYSASWLHTADSCNGTGPSGNTLCMGGTTQGVTGTLTGTYENGVLSGLGGSLWINGVEYMIDGGSLGGAFVYGDDSDWMYSNWYIDIRDHGRFFFEDLGMQDGPNQLSLDELILWGQNFAVYSDQCEQAEQICAQWGIDLYGHAVSVPEPGTLVLLSAGLFGMALMQRRRKVAYASKI